MFLFLFKQPGKIKGIVISHRPGYITDRQIGFLQKRTGPPDPVIQQIFLRRAAGDILKEAVQVGPLNIQVIRNYLDINGVGIIVFNIAQRFLYVADFLFLRRNIGSGKFAGQKIQIYCPLSEVQGNRPGAEADGEKEPDVWPPWCGSFL